MGNVHTWVLACGVCICIHVTCMVVCVPVYLIYDMGMGMWVCMGTCVYHGAGHGSLRDCSHVENGVG